jgi:3-carboxy-cis,cis-muconate cycloisomerase
MVQEHERALGGWQAEWETLPDIARLCAGALANITEVAAGLDVDIARLSANLAMTRGLVLGESVMLALGASIGRLRAHELVEHASREAVRSGRTLREVLGDNPDVTRVLGNEQLDALFDPANYSGQARQFVDAVLECYRSSRS